jgi:hypothetical protein
MATKVQASPVTSTMRRWNGVKPPSRRTSSMSLARTACSAIRPPRPSVCWLGGHQGGAEGGGRADRAGPRPHARDLARPRPRVPARVPGMRPVRVRPGPPAPGAGVHRGLRAALPRSGPAAHRNPGVSALPTTQPRHLFHQHSRATPGTMVRSPTAVAHSIPPGRTGLRVPNSYRDRLEEESSGRWDGGDRIPPVTGS